MSTDISKCGHGRVLVLSCIVLFFFSTVMSPSLFSQTASTGGLSGTLKDSSGAVVPNATVTATSIGTAQARTSTTDTEGTYRFGLLPPGTYSLKFEASGFTAVEVSSVTIVVTETSVLDQTLQVGVQTQQVEVRSEAEAVQTASSTVGTVVTGNAVADLPLTSRNYTNLLGLAAGANTGVFNAGNMGKGTEDISVNGAGITQNEMQMDGANIVNSQGKGVISDSGAHSGISVVNPDAIQEFKIQTALFDAGYGRKTGANVNVVTKSGTNEFHGAAFEFLRNTVLNANDFFRNLNLPPNNTRPVLNQNQYGGTFGGPLKKDKIFFFTAYQETQQKNGLSPAGYSDPTIVGIPQSDRSNTAAFQAALGAAFCPGGSAAGTTKSSSVVQVACNGSNINPVAMNLLQLKNPNGTYFIPSSFTGQNQNVTYSIPATFEEHQAIGNFDYVYNDKNTLSGRWLYDTPNSYASMVCGVAATVTTATQCLPGSPATVTYPNQYAVLKLTSILSNNFVNEARISMQRWSTALQNEVPFTDTQVGITPLVPTVNALDVFTISGLMEFGAIGNNSSIVHTTHWEAADQISWSHEKHTIRAGFEYEKDRGIWDLVGVSIGAESFNTFPDFLLGLPGCAPGVSSSACAASAAAGQTNGSSSSNISNTGTTTALTGPRGLIKDMRAPVVSAFVQDDFKVRRNLTLNLGLRWEDDPVFYDGAGDTTNIWPSLINTVNVPVTLGGTLGTTAATGTLAGFVVPSNFNFAANPAPPVGGLFQNSQKLPTQNRPSLTNFAPRFGFAWTPLSSDRFVVRGGAGYFYDRTAFGIYSHIAQGFPYAQTVSQSGAAIYLSSEAQPYAYAPSTVAWSPRWVNVTSGTSSNLNAYLLTPNYLTPLSYVWNLNVQYEFLSRWVLELGYVGSRGIHEIPNNSNSFEENEAQLASPTNPINGITTNTVANASVRVPYLGFSPGGLQANASNGDLKFNSLQATVRKQLSHGLQLQAAYTFSRSTDTADNLSYNNPALPLQYGPNPYYRPQRLAITYGWNLPLGSHDGFVGKVANGWNVAGVTVAQDGTPLTITDTRGGTIYGFGGGSPQLSTAEFATGMGPANVATSGSLTQRLGGSAGGPGYFNKAAFSTTPVIGNGTGYGNSGYGIILGPGQFNFDASIQKTTKVGGIHEDATLVFRTEFFNMFNHPQFNNPAVVDDSKSTFGQIVSASVNPRLIQFALKYVF